MVEAFIELEGAVTVADVVARAGTAIRDLWDGTYDQVAVIARVSPTLARLGFSSRASVVFQLTMSTRGVAVKRLEQIGALLEKGPRLGLPCLLLGFGDPVLVALDRSELGRGVAAPRANDAELAELYEACSVREGALVELEALRHFVVSKGGRSFPELEALERALDRQWDDPVALAHAVNRAKAVIDVSATTAAEQRAEMFLDVLSEVTATRCVSRINSRGGSA